MTDLVNNQTFIDEAKAEFEANRTGTTSPPKLIHIKAERQEAPTNTPHRTSYHRRGQRSNIPPLPSNSPLLRSHRIRLRIPTPLGPPAPRYTRNRNSRLRSPTNPPRSSPPLPRRRLLQLLPPRRADRKQLCPPPPAIARHNLPQHQRPLLFRTRRRLPRAKQPDRSRRANRVYPLHATLLSRVRDAGALRARGDGSRCERYHRRSAGRGREEDGEPDDVSPRRHGGYDAESVGRGRG